jgi:lysyl-tRNA synthetase class 2
MPEDYKSDKTRIMFDNLCKQHNVECKDPRSTSRLIDKLIGEFIEPNLINPTYLMEHP